MMMSVRLLCAAAVFLGICACRLNAHEDSPRQERDTAADVFVGGVQYASSGVGEMDLTVEVLLKNRGRTAVRMAEAELDGIVLPPPPRQNRTQALDAFGVEGARHEPPRNSPSYLADARWWQFYPSPRIAPGESVVFQLNAVGRARSRQLRLKTDDGRTLRVTVPPYLPRARRILHLGVTGDGQEVSVSYSPGLPPLSVTVNGEAVPFRSLRPADAGRTGAVVAALPAPVQEGDSLLVELAFPGGATCFGFVRALLGILTEAPDGWDETRPLPRKERNRFGFDETLRIRRLPIDVVCDDARAGVCGHSAQTAVAARVFEGRRHPGALCGIDFCTALQPSTCPIYAPLADAVFLKPYRLHWGMSPNRYMDEEVDFVGAWVAAVAPRPAVWIPERFGGGCGMDGREFEVLAWSALVSGVRGIRVHHWMNARANPFGDNPGLGEAIGRFNAALNRHRRVLERLIPVGSRTLRRGSVHILEGWCGDAGALLLVRNLDYETGIERKGGQLNRRHPFAVRTKGGVEIDADVPPWLEPRGACDLLTGAALDMEDGDGRIRVRIPELGAFCLVWIANGR